MNKIIKIPALLLLIVCFSFKSSYSAYVNHNDLLFEKSTKDNDEKNKQERIKILEKLRSFKASIYKNQDLNDFNYHLKVYVIDADIETVWYTYTNSKPTESWRGPLNTYKHSYSTKEDKIYLAKDTLLPSIQLGMVYELNLNIVKLFNVGVAFKITTLDHNKKTIEFTYGKDNRSHGKQKIIFSEFKGKTYIFHSSNFKSDNKIRDKYLYPKFHETCMDEFHNNMIDKIMNLTKENYLQTSYLFNNK